MTDSEPTFPQQGPGLETAGRDNLPGWNILAERNRRLDSEVKSALTQKVEAVSALQLPELGSYFSAALNERIAAAIRELDYDDSLISIGPPTKKNAITKDVDLAFNVAKIAKEASKHAPDIANEIANRLRAYPFITEAFVSGAFVNVRLNFKEYAPVIIAEILNQGEHFGHFRNGAPKVVVIDYSSPNIAKNMTVAHLRSTIIGHSLMKIQQAAGNIPFGINHIGDWGAQFGGIIYEYQREMTENPEEFNRELQVDPTATLMRIYRAFNERYANDPESAAAAQGIFLRLEQGDPELMELWHQFSVWSMNDFYSSYARLGVNFDAIQGESFYEDRMPAAVQDALERGVLRRNQDGAVVLPSQPLTHPTTGAINEGIMLGHGGNPKDEIIVKPSGGTVYLTRDLAAIRYRGQELGADRILYVIGKEQYNHCLELFAMADQLGYVLLGDAEHVSFGHLNVDGRKMKSRAGKVTLLNDLLDETVTAAEDMMRSRKKKQGDKSDLTEIEKEIARKIGIGAVIFNDLRQNREKDIEFDPDFAKGLEAGSAAYVQYTSSRLTGILEKVGSPSLIIEVPGSLSEAEKQILTEAARFPLVVQEAALRNAPHIISSYLTDFCGVVNFFYHNHPVALAGLETERNFRLYLVSVARQVIANAANLIHLELPERM